MNRIHLIREYVDNIFESIPDNNVKRAAYIHSYGVSGNCVLLAEKRGLDTEIATIIGLLHDIYTYKTGYSPLHSINGAEMIRVAFKYELHGMFTQEEELLIKSAIYHHSDKGHKHDPYDELLKDSDVLQHYQYDLTFMPTEITRLYHITKELNIKISNENPSNHFTLNSIECKTKHNNKVFLQSIVGDIAEELASKNIEGSRDNIDYMDIIRYYPEKTAFDELQGFWCAAFVYHCCIKAGVEIPLKSPCTSIDVDSYRFACVLAWYQWASRKGYCFYEEKGYTPERGDIVIYNNIIQKDRKAENSAWCDHIGIVLECSEYSLLVAEGNMDNSNVSGVLERKRDSTIGCYIKIPSTYEFEDWKLDYKTGKIRIEEYE